MQRKFYTVTIEYHVPYRAEVEVVATNPGDAEQMAMLAVSEDDYLPQWDASTATSVVKIMAEGRPVLIRPVEIST